MAGLADVTLLSWANDPDPEHVAAVADVVRSVVVRSLGVAPMGLAHRLGRWARAVGGDLPPWIQALRTQRAGAPVTVADLGGPFDVVVAEEDAAAALLPATDAPVVVHRHNVFSHTLRDLRRSAARLAWPIESRVWRRFDRSSPGAHHVAPTEECATALRGLGIDPVSVVRSGVDLRAVPVDCAAGRDIALIGTMDYRPNAEGAEWFVRRVWPRVRKLHRGSTLRVIGRGAPDLRHLAADGVSLVGYVDDLAAACAGVRCGVVPLHAGLGIKTKTLDLLAMGIPVVATPVGAEGIESGPVVAADAPSFADAVGELLADASRAERLGGAGRRYVAERFSWDASAATYLSILRSVARTPEAVRP